MIRDIINYLFTPDNSKGFYYLRAVELRIKNNVEKGDNNMKSRYTLDCSPTFKNATIEERKKICNGCGTNDWKGRLVPNKIFGMNLKPACGIHDWDYYYGKSWEDKKKGDKRFLNNLEKIEQNTPLPFWAVFGFQKRRVIKARQEACIAYYSTVKYLGAGAFWKGKVRPD